MSEAAQMDYFFNFKFNLHKSLLPIGIDDQPLEACLQDAGLRLCP